MNAFEDSIKYPEFYLPNGIIIRIKLFFHFKVKGNTVSNYESYFLNFKINFLARFS